MSTKEKKKLQVVHITAIDHMLIPLFEASESLATFDVFGILYRETAQEIGRAHV